MGTIREPMYRQFQGNSLSKSMQALGVDEAQIEENVTPTNLGYGYTMGGKRSLKPYHVRRRPAFRVLWISAWRSGDSDLRIRFITEV
jgi:hypothetical protein